MNNKLILNTLIKALPNKDFLTPAGKQLIGTAVRDIQLMTAQRGVNALDDRTMALCKLAERVLQRIQTASNFNRWSAKDFENFYNDLSALGENMGSFVPPVFNPASAQLVSTLKTLMEQLVGPNIEQYLSLADDLEKSKTKEYFNRFIAEATTNLDLFNRIQSSDRDSQQKHFFYQKISDGIEKSTDHASFASSMMDEIVALPNFTMTRHIEDTQLLAQNTGYVDTHGLPNIQMNFQPDRFAQTAIRALLGSDQDAEQPTAYQAVLAKAGCENIHEAIDAWNNYRKQLNVILAKFSDRIAEYKDPSRYEKEADTMLDQKMSTLGGLFKKGLKEGIKKFLPKTDPGKITLLDSLLHDMQQHLGQTSNYMQALYYIMKALETHKCYVQQKGISAGACGEMINDLYADICTITLDPQNHLLADFPVMNGLILAHNKANPRQEIDVKQALSAPLDELAAPSISSTSTSSIQ